MSRVSILFLVPVLIWGTTWIVIVDQLHQVSPEVSVLYRFALAAVMAFGAAALRKAPLKLSPSAHVLACFQGLFMFCMNYVLTYHSERYLSSGLVALIFSFLLYFNMIGQKLLFSEKPDSKTWIGAGLGAVGLILIFNEDLSSLLRGDSRKTILGLALALFATFLASCGNMIASKNSRMRVNIFSSTAWGMLYGFLWCCLVVVVRGEGLVWDSRPSYLGGLLYLSLFGTVFAFHLYLRLIADVGPTRAAYAAIAIPMVALVVSTFFENFQWAPHLALGVVFILSGNYFVLKSSVKKTPANQILTAK